jgi:hypothetical protein
MSNERRKRIEQVRHKEIARHMAIFSNNSLAPQLKENSKRRLIELNVLDETGVINNSDRGLAGITD